MGLPDLGLEAQKAGMMVRWGGEIRPADPARRHEETDAALARLDTLLADAASANPVDAGLLTQLCRDRVVALRDRNRWADALRQVEQLRAGGDGVPPYVRQAEADSLLALRRPADAKRAYSDVIETEPRNANALIGRFYSEVETEDFRAAFDTIDRLAQSSAAIVGDAIRAADAIGRDWLAHCQRITRRRFDHLPVHPLGETHDSHPARPISRTSRKGP